MVGDKRNDGLVGTLWAHLYKKRGMYLDSKGKKARTETQETFMREEEEEEIAM